MRWNRLPSYAVLHVGPFASAQLTMVKLSSKSMVGSGVGVTAVSSAVGVMRGVRVIGTVGVSSIVGVVVSSGADVRANVPNTQTSATVTTTIATMLTVNQLVRRMLSYGMVSCRALMADSVLLSNDATSR